MQLQKSKLLNNFTNLTHAFSTTDGGVSEGKYNSLNLGFHVNDNKKAVQKNHYLLAKKLSYKKESLIYMNQIHSDIVYKIKDNDNFDTRPSCDALITDKKQKTLMVMVADCSPILFYDAKKEVIAVAHSGRVGTFKNIIKNVVDSFINEYKSNPKDIIVSIGVKINVCCYEVGAEIYQEAKRLNLEYAIEKRDEKLFLNIEKILLSQLLDAKIDKKNIEFFKECSCCDKNYFSYRRDGVTGRFAGVISLK